MGQSFADKDFAARFSAMGDQAEGVFEEVYPKGWVRWGLCRPPINVGSLSMKIRYAPDYLTSDGFVEVMGVGEKQVLRLKVEKHICLLQWNQEMPTRLFIWDSKQHRYTSIGMQQLTEAISNAKPGSFPEGKPTWDIPVKHLAAEWQQKPSSTPTT